MYCRVNQLPGGDQARVLRRVEKALGRYAQLVDYFDLVAPQDQESTSLTVYWKDRQRPDTFVTIPDETSPEFEAELIGLLAP